MEDQLIQKYQTIIDNLKDGQSATIRRETVIKGKTKPFGTLTRQGNIIKYQPAKSMSGYAKSWADDKAASCLVDIELLASFSF